MMHEIEMEPRSEMGRASSLDDVGADPQKGSRRQVRATRSRQALQAIALLAGLTLSSTFTSPALAQSSLAAPPVFQTSDRFGVDIVSGNVSVSSPTISVGDPAHGGLSFTATWDGFEGDWRYSNWGEIRKADFSKNDIYCESRYTVTFMGKSSVFQRYSCGSPLFGIVEGYGSLIQTASGYVYTAPDGSVASFGGGGGNMAPTAPFKYQIGSITKLNGEVIVYNYGFGGLISISNNFGYQLHFDYVGSGTSIKLSKVTALNNAVDACAPTAATCTYSATWPSLTFTQGSGTASVVDNLGRTTRVTFSGSAPNAQVVSTARPTKTSGASVTYTYARIPGFGWRVSSASDGDGTWQYDYEYFCVLNYDACPPPQAAYDADTTVTDPNGGETIYNVFWYPFPAEEIPSLPALTSIADPLNHTTAVSQDAAGLHFVGYPEGNDTAYFRNDLGLVYRVRNRPKPGSSEVETNITAVYPDCATEPVRCHFPTSVTDARGNTTDYTYDAAGNLLTETGPAPTIGAPRPQTRYTWEQRYAWYKRNGSSSITQAASPVWVMVEQSQCMTGATC
jgi:YD repeat-containing protein